MYVPLLAHTYEVSSKFHSNQSPHVRTDNIKILSNVTFFNAGRLLQVLRNSSQRNLGNYLARFECPSDLILPPCTYRLTRLSVSCL